jgi:formate-dependent nitrite reductase membrane component NrfD
MKHMEWGFLIVNYLFLGGLSAGLFFVSALITLSRRESGDLPRIARWSALLVPLPVILGCTLLIFDLGRWYAFYKLFLHFRWTSPMSIGTWLLVTFTLVSLAYGFAWLPNEVRRRIFARVPARWRLLHHFNRDCAPWQRPLAMIGLPLSVAVGIYTGVLLGAVQSRPFWNTNLVAQLFLVSALSTGCAVLILTLVLDRRVTNTAPLRFLYSLDLVLLTLELFIVVPYLIHGQLSVRAVQESLKLILGGPFTLAFWLLFFTLGLLLPLVAEAWETIPVLLSGGPFHVRRALGIATAALILIGGFVLRYVFVYAGQASVFR